MDPRDLRVGDADREHVAGLLQRAVGDGMLTLDEFTERMDTAMAARTRGELDTVLADLPGTQLAGSSSSAAPAGAGPPLPLTATLSSIERSGNWRVPGLVTVRGRFSAVVLDFTRAEVRTPVVTIDVDDMCSSIEILVPDDFTADVDDLRCLGSSASAKVRSAPPAGRVHLVVRGKLRFSSLTVKYPFGTRIRKWLGS